jgi:hypothetical protein
MPPSCTCTAARKPDGYNKAHLQEFGEVLQAWMLSQIPGGADGLGSWCATARRCAAQPSRQTTEATAMASGRLRLCRSSHRLRQGPWRGPGPEGLRHPRIQ